MSWIKNQVKKPIVFYCIYIFSLIFLVELFSFAILKYKEVPLDGSASRHFYHPYRGHQLNPDYNRKFDTDNKRIHSIDGFRRDMPVSQAKPPNTYRIILMGGSAAYGIGTNVTDTNYPLYPSLKNTETIDYYLQSYLNKNEDIIKSKKKVEVINAAVTAYWTFQHLLYVNESLYKYKPDLIIFLDGHNDFYQHHLFPSTMEDYSFSSPKLITSLNNRSAVFTAYMFTRYFGQYSFSFKLLEKTLAIYFKYSARAELASNKSLNRIPTKDYESAAKNSFIKNYAQIKTLGNLFDFKISVFLQPQVVLENNQYLSKEDQKVKKLTTDYLNVTYRNDNRLKRMKNIRIQLPKIFDKYNIPFHDIATIASNKTQNENLYYDYCHLSPIGASTVAKKIAENIKELILEK